MQPVSTALIGFGKAGQWLHAPFIHTLPFFSFRYILERSADLAAALYPSVQTVRELSVILDDPSIELVVIATPNTTHASFIIQALEAGKHVVVDKPFTITEAEALEVQKISLKTGKQVFVYQNRRWDGDFLTIQKLLEQKTAGEVHSIESRYDRYRPEPRLTYWKESAAAGNGLWYDLGPHLLDQALYLFGTPDRMFAEVKTERPGGQGTDYFDVELIYPTLSYRIHAGMMEARATPRWQIKGSKALYIKYGTDPQETRLSKGEMPEGNDWGEENDPEAVGLLTLVNGQTLPVVQERGDYRCFYQKVYQSVREGHPFPVSITDAVTLVTYLERIQSVAGKGKTEVKV